MIAKKYRLREYEVSRVFKKGRPYFGTYWTMNCLEVRNATSHKMAVSISRKHDKRAVQRNRYRRGLYDGLKDLLIVNRGLLIVTDTNSSNDKLGTINHKRFLCVFTLKKGLKIPEKKIPTEWVEDARKLLKKVSQGIMN